ncbi:hypothetical protein CBS147343_10644 [Aspergillus niger]|nr:hypothetical protein CBS11852_8305 [Aspergillus niger]KAI2990993.1 hypothetical protein CBS147345_10459 [Aspergillus niger]KAI3056163.1 hypothetical protein CBS147343_10644 [Aspergillus niger]
MNVSVLYRDFNVKHSSRTKLFLLVLVVKVAYQFFPRRMPLTVGVEFEDLAIVLQADNQRNVRFTQVAILKSF